MSDRQSSPCEDVRGNRPDHNRNVESPLHDRQRDDDRSSQRCFDGYNQSTPAEWRPDRSSPRSHCDPAYRLHSGDNQMRQSGSRHSSLNPSVHGWNQQQSPAFHKPRLQQHDPNNSPRSHPAAAFSSQRFHCRDQSQRSSGRDLNTVYANQLSRTGPCGSSTASTSSQSWSGDAIAANPAPGWAAQRDSPATESNWNTRPPSRSSDFQQQPTVMTSPQTPPVSDRGQPVQREPQATASRWTTPLSSDFISQHQQPPATQSGWSAPPQTAPDSSWAQQPAQVGWNSQQSSPVSSNWQTTTSEWSAPANSSSSGWDAPIVRKSLSSADDVPLKKVLTRETEIEELFGSSLHPISSSGINFDKYDSIPVSFIGGQSVQPIESFVDLALHDMLVTNIGRARYSRPTPIQKYAIPIILQKRDLMACAQTGSGKTAAFLVPAIDAILSGNLPQLSDADMTHRCAYPRVVILSPTRELALQTHFESRKFCFDTQCSCVVVYGGQDIRIQVRDLSYGCDVLVATPGRLTDFLEKNRISLQNVQLLIFDEADRMLDMVRGMVCIAAADIIVLVQGFEPQIRRIVEQSDMMQSAAGRQTVMFSATYPRSIQRVASQFLRDYLHLTVGRVGSTTNSIRQVLQYSEEHTKRNELLEWMPKIDGLAVVFVATKRTADMLADWFRRQNIDAVLIHGDRTQEQREDALQEFRIGKVKFLVATDVAARGLDIANVLWVINYDLPNTIDDYIHRIGRTGRCGNTGTALSFVNETSGIIIRHLYDLLIENGQKVPEFLQRMVDAGVPEREQFHRRGGRGGGRPPRYKFRSNASSAPVFRDRNAKTFEIG